ncbi:hypothetical protein [Bifidobacterium pseudolongum]|uniref:Uncharacterized protein n=1 Tax=Bifidobacterium pseudolongum subsp. globosum TaxID=1690 RepID=A0A2N3R737_9BIFI|nr:hypothetical protein [Bifidobacterium pseudolongum]PKV05164.1 hypothetical protein CQR50_0418 [Bifidobacterium pseudolongum subsp. globosum]
MVERYDLPADDERTSLRNGVVRALRAVPMHFTSPINIEGLSATDLFSMNTLLGGAIEDQTVATLNATRAIWDPNGRWADYEFRRYSESFPDVRLENMRGAEPLIGIELKGWYLLAKEEMPSFRFRASADAMTVWDLLVVFPWSLSNVLSGTPVLEPPFIEQAKYAADLRTQYWENRNASAKPVTHPPTHPYPAPGTAYSDVVYDDRGGNFGRIARIQGLMDEWMAETMDTRLAGISAKWWVRFFKLFDERGDLEAITKRFDRLARETNQNPIWVEEVVDLVRQLMKL